MSRAEIYLKRNKEESLKRHHPWLFSGAIERAEVEEQLTEGEVVDIFTKGGEYIASGHYQVVDRCESAYIQPRGDRPAVVEQTYFRGVQSASKPTTS